MRLIPSSFNGFLFQQGKSVASDWNTKFDWSIGGITANNIPRSQNFPSYAAKGYSASIKVITVNFTNIDADRDSLVIAMDVLGEEQHKLYATDKFGRAWYVNAVCIGLNEEDVSADTAVFGAIFDVDDPIWKLATPSSLTMQTLYGTASGTIVPIGNQSALPVITITPTAGGGYGFSYKQFVTIINNSPNPLVVGGCRMGYGYYYRRRCYAFKRRRLASICRRGGRQEMVRRFEYRPYESMDKLIVPCQLKYDTRRGYSRGGSYHRDCD
jgi:hypothetical protein